MKGSVAQTLHGDILYEFFSHTLPSLIVPSQMLAVSPLNVSMVCRSWRGVALERTSLWASVSIVLGEDKQGALTDDMSGIGSVMKYVQMWLQRSSSSPLDIVLETSTPRTLADAEMEEAFKAIISEGHRWRNVSLKNVHRRDLVGQPISIASEYLASLSFSGHPFFNRPFLLDFTSSPHLHSLEVANGVNIRIQDNIHLRMFNLSHLDISAAPFQGLDDILALLEAAPNLLHLSLVFKNILVPSSRSEVVPVRLSSLSTLRLRFFELCKTPFPYFLSWLSCPALSSLSVANYRREEAEHAWDDLEEMDRFLRRSGAPRLTELIIKYDELPATWFTEDQRQRIQAALILIIHRLDRLEVLEVDFVLICDKFIEALNLLSGGACCTALKSFSLFTSGIGLEQQTVLDMIVSRRNCGRALESVFVDVPRFEKSFEDELGGFNSECASLQS